MVRSAPGGWSSWRVLNRAEPDPAVAWARPTRGPATSS